VIRGAHIIPAFAWGKTKELLAHGSVETTDEEDWQYYYVNFFVDRDMYMRYRGGGVGHYQVPIPPEDDAAPTTPTEEEDPEFPISIPVIPPLPPLTPPQSPEAGPTVLSDSRPPSSLSQNSDNSEGAHTPLVSESESELEDERNQPVEGLGEEEGSEDDDLGPEDGDGDIEDEVEEGYTPL
ncbi:hypothetical protein C8R44DRAFT_911496, partial [Mycena epipterygia]